MDTTKLENYLIELGFKPSLIGFNYLVNAIMKVRSNPAYKRNMFGVLYPLLVEDGYKPQSVERSIRYIKEGTKYEDKSVAETIALLEIETRGI